MLTVTEVPPRAGCWRHKYHWPAARGLSTIGRLLAASAPGGAGCGGAVWDCDLPQGARAASAAWGALAGLGRPGGDGQATAPGPLARCGHEAFCCPGVAFAIADCCYGATWWLRGHVHGRLQRRLRHTMGRRGALYRNVGTRRAELPHDYGDEWWPDRQVSREQSIAGHERH